MTTLHVHLLDDGELVTTPYPIGEGVPTKRTARLLQGRDVAYSWAVGTHRRDLYQVLLEASLLGNAKTLGHIEAARAREGVDDEDIATFCAANDLTITGSNEKGWWVHRKAADWPVGNAPTAWEALTMFFARTTPHRPSADLKDHEQGLLSQGPS